MDTSQQSSFSFRSAWIHKLDLHLPTLAITVDDALLTFVDHLSVALARSSVVQKLLHPADDRMNAIQEVSSCASYPSLKPKPQHFASTLQPFTDKLGSAVLPDNS